MSQELLIEIAQYRIKMVEGLITDRELQDALKKMRENRLTAAAASPKKKKTGVALNPDEVLALFSTAATPEQASSDEDSNDTET